jgi:preprotein translocase subunit SecF
MKSFTDALCSKWEQQEQKKRKKKKEDTKETVLPNVGHRIIKAALRGLLSLLTTSIYIASDLCEQAH